MNRQTSFLKLIDKPGSSIQDGRGDEYTCTEIHRQVIDHGRPEPRSDAINRNQTKNKKTKRKVGGGYVKEKRQK